MLAAGRRQRQCVRDIDRQLAVKAHQASEAKRSSVPTHISTGDRLRARRCSCQARGTLAFGNAYGVDFFLDGPNAKPSEGVHLIFEGEKIKAEYFTTSATLNESESSDHFRVVSLDALVRMKLESNRPKDQAHVVDLFNVGHIDETWPAKFPSPLRERLELLINDPNNRQLV